MKRVSFEGQVAIVTGGGRGLGLAHARLLGQRGAKVVVNATTSATDAVRILRGEGIEAVSDHHDIESRQGAEALVQNAITTFGQLDIVINNADIGSPGRFADETDEAFDRAMKVNAYGVRNVIKTEWTHMLERRYGRIVNIGSGAGMLGLANQTGNSGTKAAVYGLTRGLAAEVDEFDLGDIKINALTPGAYTRLAAESEASDELKERMRKTMPPELVAPAVVALPHNGVPVNGAIIDAGGGRAEAYSVNVTVGLYDPDLTVEKIFEKWDAVTGKDGMREFANATLPPQAFIGEALHRAGFTDG